MTTRATYTTDGLRHDVADPATATVRICAARCGTCIFRPGNLMLLEPGRVQQMVRDAISSEGHIVCHSTLDTEAPAICAGFAAHPQGSRASLALRFVAAKVLRATLVDAPSSRKEPVTTERQS